MKIRVKYGSFAPLKFGGYNTIIKITNHLHQFSSFFLSKNLKFMLNYLKGGK